MLKFTIQIKETGENAVSVSMNKLKEKELDKATQSEKITAVEIKTSIDYALSHLEEMNKLTNKEKEN